MTVNGDLGTPAPVVPPRRSFGRDVRLVLATAGFTSLFWVIVMAFGGANLFTIKRVQPEAASTNVLPNGLTAKNFDTAPVGSVAPTPLVYLPPGTLLIPVEGVGSNALIDTFDEQRGERRHEALDIVAPLGTPVVSASAGMVEKLFLSDAGGKTIYVRSQDGNRIFYYAHLDAYASGLAEGDIVSPGQRIGTVGVSGNADPATPHLHFAILRVAPDEPWWKGTPENPYDLLMGTRADQTGAK